MRLGWRRWETWCIVAAVGGAVAYGAWANWQPSLPPVPRPTGITEREVQQMLYGGAQKVEREPRSAEAWAIARSSSDTRSVSAVRRTLSSCSV